MTHEELEGHLRSFVRAGSPLPSGRVIPGDDNNPRGGSALRQR